MVSLSAVLGMSIVALGMVLTPGPNMFYLVSRSISQGRLAGLYSLIGVALGFLIYLVSATLGISVIFIAVPGLYVMLKFSGAAYLFYLAWKALRPGAKSIFEETTMPPDSKLRLITMGLTTNLLNPKIAVMYLSLIPQFIDPTKGHVVAQGLILGGVQIGISLSVNLLIVLSAGAIGRFFSGYPNWLRFQKWLMGTVLGALGLKIALDNSGPASN